MRNNAEQSIPSRGSHGSPVAWALMQPDSYSVFASRALAEKKRVLCFGGDIVPLYRQPQPTLTDEERTAIELARSVFDDYKMSRLHNAADEVLEHLLERLT